jgi:predicted aspartyl protease
MNDKHNCKIKCLSSAMIFLLFAIPSAHAADVDEYALSASLYKKKHFREALTHIDKALTTRPNDSNVLYYKAVILTQLNNPTEAKKIYGELFVNFPNTDAARNSEIALNYLDPNYLKTLKPVSKGPEAPPPAEDPSSSLPSQTKVYFTLKERDLIIDAFVNNQPVKMWLDLGSSECVFGKELLKGLSINVAGTAKPSKDNKTEPVEDLKETKANLKVGDIDRHNFNISIADKLDHPMLGKTFFLNYNYEIDYKNNVINMTRVGGLKDDRNAIKFTREGRDMVVKADFGGKTINAIIDTNSDETSMTAKQAKALGLTVPEWDEGDTGPKKIWVPVVKCGPLMQPNIEVTVVIDPARDKENRPAVLGKEFCGNVRFTVDDANQCLRLKR